MESQFRDRMKHLAMTEDEFSRIWQIVHDMGQYSFSKNHATAYAMLSYSSAVAKVHASQYFMANLLSNTYEKNNAKVEQELRESVRDCSRLGLKFLPLDINKSQWRFTAEGPYIRIGFCAIKGFGEKAAAEILSKRPFTSVEDVIARLERRSCSMSALTPLTFAGAFCPFGLSDKVVYEAFCADRKIKTINTSIKVGKGTLSTSEPALRRYGKLLGVDFSLAC